MRWIGAVSGTALGAVVTSATQTSAGRMIFAQSAAREDAPLQAQTVP